VDWLYYWIIFLDGDRMKTEIFESYEDFVNREDKSVNGVSPEYAGNHPDYELMNESNVGCWNCVACTECVDCVRCYACHGITGMNDAWRVKNRKLSVIVVVLAALVTFVGMPYAGYKLHDYFHSEDCK
jgi:hypothetical protein